jgi:ferritin-like metal-binding protein YciE
MATQSLRELYLEELRDLFDAEQQILASLPTMISSASSPALKRVFEDHLEQTRVQSERLQLIFKQLGEPSQGKRCLGMDGLIKEGQERLRMQAQGDVRDAALISAAQRIEHYEIAGYGTARTYAERLGAFDQADVLQATLDEEGEADHRLTGIAESGVNQAARREGASEDVRLRGRLRFVDVEDLPTTDVAYTEVALRNRAGDDLGSLDGFIVEGSGGRPVYYVVDSGGWFIGRRYLIPIGKGRLDAASRTLTIDLDREQLQRYPEFNTNAFLTMSDEQVRGYERRLLATISPGAGREGRPWESYDRLPDYTPPAWLATTSWVATSTGIRNAARERPGDAARAREGEPARDRELITAREDASTIVEPQQSHPSESVRGIVEETRRPSRDEDDERLR